MVGERFCVRNSGATAVVEGVGDHGMRVHDRWTGGGARVPPAATSVPACPGGVAYIWDPKPIASPRCSTAEMVDIDPLE